MDDVRFSLRANCYMLPVALKSTKGYHYSFGGLMWRHMCAGLSSIPGLTNHLLLQKEKATKDYMQLSNPPDSNALQVVDADGNFHVIY